MRERRNDGSEATVMVSVLRYVESTSGDGLPTAVWIISSRTFFAEVSQC